MFGLKPFISYLHDIEDTICVVLMEDEKSWEFIHYLLQVRAFSEVYIFTSNLSVEQQKLLMEETRSEHVFWNQKIEHRGNSKFTLFFDQGVEVSLLEQYAELPYRYVLGVRLENIQETYAIWEQFHICAEHIFIQTEITKVRRENKVAERETLRWNRTDGNCLLSVILPVYNVAKYLDKCMESMLVWQAPYVEYIFVNDGTPDDSVSILEKYQRKDSRIKIVNKQNGGCASARNAGLAAAKGFYVAFFDPDDFMDPTMYQKLLCRAMTGRYDLAYCGYREYYEDTGEFAAVTNEVLAAPYVYGETNRYRIDKLVNNTRVAIWRYIFRREVLLENYIKFYEDLKRFDDLPFRVEAIFACKSAVCVPEHLYYYRLGRAGQDVSCNDERLYVHFDIFKHLDQKILPMKKQHRIDFLQIIKINTHGYALSKLQKKYKNDYRKRAKMDLQKNMGMFRTLILLLGHAGKQNLGWLLLSCIRR